MREIKFRAWDVENKRFRDSSLAFAVGEISSRANEAGYELQQFTGLKDKNGKEIYEGDIVRCGEYEDDIDAKNWKVVYETEGHYPAFDLKGWHEETNGLSMWINAGFVEVIGNIYENPELLEKK